MMKKIATILLLAMFVVSALGLPVGAQETPGVDVDCQRTIGYWKTHPEAWSGMYLLIGNEWYTQDELLAILWTSPKGDASIILAHQLIAAELNIWVNNAYIWDDWDLVDAWLNARTWFEQFGGRLPYKVKTSSAQGTEAVGYAATLDAFNNGEPAVTCDPFYGGGGFE